MLNFRRNHHDSSDVSGRMQQRSDLFWKLLEPEYVRAMMFCRKLMGDRDRGDDLFQDGLVLAFTRFEDLRDQSSFKPWLYRVLINTFHSAVRRPWWKRRVPLDGDELPDSVGTDPVDRHTARRWLQRAFRAVTPAEQALVSLHELEGWPVAELARLYDTTEGAVKARLFRARCKMKKALLRLDRSSGRSRDAADVTEGVAECAVAKPGTD